MPSQEYSFLHTTYDNSPTVKTKARQQRMIRRSRWKNQEKNTLHHGTGMRACALADLQKYFFSHCERIARPLPWFSDFFSVGCGSWCKILYCGRNLGGEFSKWSTPIPDAINLIVCSRWKYFSERNDSPNGNTDVRGKTKNFVTFFFDTTHFNPLRYSTIGTMDPLSTRISTKFIWKTAESFFFKFSESTSVSPKILFLMM